MKAAADCITHDPTCGIYFIECQDNDKIYIGSSVSTSRRMKAHLRALRRNVHVNKKLQHSFNKYGEGSFAFVVLEHCAASLLAGLETYWIKALDCVTRGFNLTHDASAPCRGMFGERNPFFGKKHSEATRAKLSAINSGTNSPNFGRKASDQTRAKLSVAMRGRRRSEEACRNISLSKSGVNHPCFGKHLSSEHRENIAAAHRGRIFTPEHNARISESKRGKRLVVTDGRRRYI